MLMTLKALSAALSYPSAELQAATTEIESAIAAEGLAPASAIAALRPLLAELADGDIYDLQERYVSLFDRSRTLSLNLFEHVHGESRDRGGAMVDLLETYHAAGLEPSTGELPDHLPALLEFLAMRPLPEAIEILADAEHILQALHVRLTRRESAYAGLIDLLLQTIAANAEAARTPNESALAELLAEADEDPDDLEQLDAVWAESEVTFGPDPNAGCPAARDMLSQMAVPPTAANLAANLAAANPVASPDARIAAK